jgi:hypothetical protein
VDPSSDQRVRNELVKLGVEIVSAADLIG